jgi:hypothetical protein
MERRVIISVVLEATSSVEVIQHRIEPHRESVSDESKIMCQEAVVANLKLLCRNLNEGISKTTVCS